MKSRLAIAMFLLIFWLFPASIFAGEQSLLSTGQTIYVPVYSHVFSGDKGLPFNLAAMLSIRNVDLHNSMQVTSIEYYDNDGKLLKNYLDKPRVLGPLASDHVFIKETDEAGGFGANFIVRWAAAKKINAPIVESVMIGAKSGQGISFRCQGRVIAEDGRQNGPSSRQ